MKKNLVRSTKLFAAVASLTLAAAAPAATITWSTPEFAAETDVSTTGTLVSAIDYGDPDGSNDTLNGVEFIEVASGSWSNTQNGVTVVGSAFTGSNGYGQYYTGDVTAANNLLDSYTIGAKEDPLNFTGLTAGAEYELQFFMFDDRTNLDGRGRVADLSDDSTFDEAGDLNDFDFTDPSPEQTVIGTFTADPSGEQSVWFRGWEDGSGAKQMNINAMQLREIPEPTSLALLALGVTALLGRRRQRA